VQYGVNVTVNLHEALTFDERAHSVRIRASLHKHIHRGIPHDTTGEVGLAEESVCGWSGDQCAHCSLHVSERYRSIEEGIERVLVDSRQASTYASEAQQVDRIEIACLQWGRADE
jgi:hypothetical protein